MGSAGLTTRGRMATRAWWMLPTPILLQVVLLAGVFMLSFFVATDPDLWWHLATGKYIVENGTIPTQDIFSYTAAGKPWVAHEWLAEITMYLTYRAGGYMLSVVFFAGLATLTYFMVLRTIRLMGYGVIGAAMITAWIAAMSWASWNVRPQVYSYLFFAIYLYLLLRSREQQSKLRWLMPVVMVVWVNVHAGFVMGLVLIGCFVAGEAINVVASGGLRGGAQTLSRFAAVGAATVGAAALNPSGPAILLYPFTYSGTQNASMRFIEEWQSPNFHNYYYFVFGAAILALMAFRGRRPQDWAITVPVIVVTAMTLQSVRVVPFFAIAAAPCLALRLLPTPAAKRSEGPDRSDASDRSDGTRRRAAQMTGLNWLVLAACLGAIAMPLFISDRAQVGPQPIMKDYPVGGVNYLRASGLTGNLFNTYHWGGYVAWSYYPEKRAFIDGRADVYGDEHATKYVSAYNGASNWRQVLDEHGVEVAIIEKESGLATVMKASGEWDEAYRGPIESVFVKTRK